ncbi:hypothetical protein TNCV_2715861 [Trichonephila clavipes]|nr:hypothetical protein TNCV_2715861 [Trichonephila clavipes]
MMLFWSTMGQDYILIDDNVQSHRAHVDDFLEEEDIRSMNWSFKSPDLSPVKHAWGGVGREIFHSILSPKTPQELKARFCCNKHILTPSRTVWWIVSLVYADKSQTLDHLEDNIRRVIADIRPQMLGKVIENWTSRLDYIRASRGSHMPEIIFKM